LYLRYEEDKDVMLDWLKLGNRKLYSNIFISEYHDVMFFNTKCKDHDEDHNRRASMKQKTLLQLLD